MFWGARDYDGEGGHFLNPAIPERIRAGAVP